MKTLLTKEIVNIVQKSMRNTHELLKDEQFKQIPEMVDIHVHLHRRAGHTTAAVQLLRDEPNSYMIVGPEGLVPYIQKEHPALKERIFGLKGAPQRFRGKPAPAFVIFDNDLHMKDEDIHMLKQQLDGYKEPVFFIHLGN